MEKIRRPLAVFFKDTDPEYLVSQVELNPSGVVVYFRVADDPKYFKPILDMALSSIGPDVVVHTPEELNFYHPQGKPKEHYRYFHHAHSPVSMSETLDRIMPFTNPRFLTYVEMMSIGERY